MTDNCYYQVNATPFSFQRSSSIQRRLTPLWISFQFGCRFCGSLRLLGLVLSHFAENTNLNNHNDTLPPAKRLAHLCVGQFQYFQVRGFKTGGRFPCRKPTCFPPLFSSLYRTDLLVYPNRHDEELCRQPRITAMRSP
jgi:hypothetical protein